MPIGHRVPIFMPNMQYNSTQALELLHDDYLPVSGFKINVYRMQLK